MKNSLFALILLTVSIGAYPIHFDSEAFNTAICLDSMQSDYTQELCNHSFVQTALTGDIKGLPGAVFIDDTLYHPLLQFLEIHTSSDDITKNTVDQFTFRYQQIFEQTEIIQREKSVVDSVYSLYLNNTLGLEKTEEDDSFWRAPIANILQMGWEYIGYPILKFIIELFGFDEISVPQSVFEVGWSVILLAIALLIILIGLPTLFVFRNIPEYQNRSFLQQLKKKYIPRGKEYYSEAEILLKQGDHRLAWFRLYELFYAVLYEGYSIPKGSWWSHTQLFQRLEKEQISVDWAEDFTIQYDKVIYGHQSLGEEIFEKQFRNLMHEAKRRRVI